MTDTDASTAPPGIGLVRTELPHRPLVNPPGLKVADIQGNLIHGYTHTDAAYIFVRITDAEAGRRWLATLVGEVTSGTPWESVPDTTLNLSFTYAGLAALGVDEAILDSFPEEFKQGMAARRVHLGDRGPSAPENWDEGFGTGEVHVEVDIHGTSNETLETRCQWLHAAIAETDGAVVLIRDQRADLLPAGRDHFGFADGVARPAIKGSGVAACPGDGLPVEGGGWRSIRPGEFVLGYEDEDGALPEAPAAPFDRNGTFEIYRKMHMEVALFRRFVQEGGAVYPGGPDLLAAKVVGRWPDGTPLSLSPDKPDPYIAGNPDRVNDFRYEDDPDGVKCPLGAHVRRTNPRDNDGMFGGKLSNRHRIVRRGRPYGPLLPAGSTEDDGVERGLVFRCFQASIARQFETIQSLWVDDGDGLHTGDDKDFLIGDGTGSNKMTIQGSPPFILSPQPVFTIVKGGEYLFRPGIGALRWLASAPPAAG
ncbi:MAG: Dyp-type peroxidase [Acidimicrobiales bacterium]